MIEKSPQNIETADQLLAMPDDGRRYELIAGVLSMMSPAGSEHGRVALRIASRLARHVEDLDLGQTYAAETGFLLARDPDTVRAPDAAFVSHQRLASVEATSGYLSLAPDLVVEVVSPSDSFSDVEAKAQQWTDSGTRIVLIADPVNQTLIVYQSASDIRVLRSGEAFESGDFCGGWKLTVDEAFDIK
jgi:Uma2 family endonuclease